LPLGRLVDTGRRMTIVSVGVAFWSAMTALCGFAGSFRSLFICRMGVGIGEASLTPSAYSIIADSVDPRRLGVALGVFTVGVQVGSGLAFLLGASVIAYIADTALADLPFIPAGQSWRAVFLLIGPPGVLVALWTATLREPTRQGAGQSRPPLAAVVAYLGGNARSMGAVYFCMAFAAMTSYAVNAWMASVLIRTFGWTAAMAGRAFGPIIIVFGALGVLAGGMLGDLVTARGRQNGRLLIMACAAIAAIPFGVMAPLASTPFAMLALLGPMIFLVTMVIGLGPSTLPELVPNQMRGFATSIGVLIVNLIGLGLGPTAVALVTDFVIGDPKLLRYSLAALLPCMLAFSATAGFYGLGSYGRSCERQRQFAQCP
jgi:MFS family permease